MPVAAVLFDCDGVLVDSEPITNTLLAEDLTTRGLPLSKDECIALFVGGTIRGVADRARALGADLPEDWIDLFYARMFDRLGQGCPTVPGIEGAVARLAAAGLGLAVGSNGPPRKMEVTLGQHPGLRAAFGPHIHSAQLLGRPKPDPLVWLHAAQGLGVQPEACVVVEDSATGARAARAAGMRCLGYAPHGGADRLAAEGAEIFADMGALPGLVGL